MKKIIYLFMLIFSMNVVLSCSDEQEDATHDDCINKDNTTLDIPDDVEYIPTEDIFAGKMLLNREQALLNESWEKDIKTKATSNPTKVLHGYDNLSYSAAGKVMFGEFIRKYGLEPNITYFRKTVTCSKRFPCSSTDAIVDRPYPGTGIPMGFIPGMLVDNKYVEGYKVGSYNPGGFRTAETFIYQVVSDISGREYNVYYPYKPEQLEWWYKVVSTDEWEF